MRYDPPEITVRAGETIRFEVKNDGKLRHEFMIILEAGEAKTLVWQFGEAGELEIGCHVPGHYEAGMLARVRVIASNNSQ